MKFTFDFGAEVDILTKDELDQSLNRVPELLRKYAEGLKAVRFAGVLSSTAGGVLPGPRQGYTWMVTLVSVEASAAATVTVALGEDGTYAMASPVTLAAAGPAVFSWSSRQVILRPGEVLQVAASAGTLGRYLIAGVEAKAEQVFKLVGG